MYSGATFAIQPASGCPVEPHDLSVRRSKMARAKLPGLPVSLVLNPTPAQLGSNVETISNQSPSTLEP